MLDLTLARTYLPACVCIMKAGCLCLALALLRALATPVFNAHVFIALLLFMDRKFRQEYIFNSNTLAMFAFAAVVFNRGRVAGQSEEMPRGKEALGLVLNCMWVLCSLAALCQVERRFALFRYIAVQPLVVTSLFVALHSFVPLPPESEAFLVLRVFDFAALSIAWIYFVNVQHVSASTVHDCTECVVFFGHVLCTPPPVTACSTVITCLLLAYLRTRWPAHDEECHDSDLEAPPSEQPLQPPNSPNTEQRELEALFLEAKARVQNTAGPRMRTPG